MALSAHSHILIAVFVILVLLGRAAITLYLRFLLVLEINNFVAFIAVVGLIAKVRSLGLFGIVLLLFLHLTCSQVLLFRILILNGPNLDTLVERSGGNHWEVRMP